MGETPNPKNERLVNAVLGDIFNFVFNIALFFVIYTLLGGIQRIRISGESFFRITKDFSNGQTKDEGEKVPWRERGIAIAISAIVVIARWLLKTEALTIVSSPYLFFVLLIVLVIVLIMVHRDGTDGMDEAKKRNGQRDGEYKRSEDSVPVVYYVKQGWRFVSFILLTCLYLFDIAKRYATLISNPTCASIVRMTPVLIGIFAVFFVLVDALYKCKKENEAHADKVRKEAEDGEKEKNELSRVIPGEKEEIERLKKRKAELENKIISASPVIDKEIQDKKDLIEYNNKKIADLKSKDAASRAKAIGEIDVEIQNVEKEIEDKKKELGKEETDRGNVLGTIALMVAQNQDTTTLQNTVATIDGRIKVLQDFIDGKLKSKTKLESCKEEAINKADEELKKLIKPIEDENEGYESRILDLEKDKKESNDKEANRQKELSEIEEKLKRAMEKVNEKEEKVNTLAGGKEPSEKRASGYERIARWLQIAAWIFIAITIIILLLYFFTHIVWASPAKVEEPVKQVVTTTPVPETPWYTFYNAELLTNDVKEDNFNFGIKLSGDDLKAEDYLRDFKERIKNDPALGAACIAWVDANMGTRYIGTFYEECQNNWATTMNTAKDSWIKDRAAYEKRLEVFFAYLDEAEVSIKTGKGIKDQMYMNPYTESKIPDIIVYETDQEKGTFLVFTFAPKNSKTKKDVSFRVDCGYQPTNVEKIMNIKPQTNPNPKPTVTPKKKDEVIIIPKEEIVNPPVVTEKPKDKTKGTSGEVVLPNDNPGPGPDTNNGVGAKYSSEQTENASIFETVKEYKEEIKELEKINETQKTDEDRSTPTVKTDKKKTTVDNNANKPNGYYDSIDEETEFKRPARKADGKAITEKAGEPWKGPSD